MTEHLLVGVASIIVLGVSARWLAWWIHLPAILLLLVFGIVAGPVTGFLHPDEVLGNLLLPLVSLSVGIILFEGGLTLSLRELPHIGRVLWSLVSLGALMTLVVSTIAAVVVLGFSWTLAILLGAILVVTGPTVIGPLLRDIRPSGQVGPILKWEGIVIDPIGATLAVLVYEAVLAGEVQQATTLVVLGVTKTVLIGGVLGVIGAGILFFVLKRYWVQDLLQNSLALMLVVAVFTAANLLQEEAGLLAVTVMGFVLANQRTVPVKHIVEFKENLRVLLISSLFIVLAARLELNQITALGVSAIFFVLILVVVARPLCVAVSTAGSGLTWRERAFLAWMAPRGIVAASVSSIFALRLSDAGYAGAENLISVTFLVIIGTVALYGLTAGPVARKLGVAKAHPQGILFVGAHSWARAIAKTLKDGGHRVYLVDTNWGNILAARVAGLPCYHGNVLGDGALEEMQLDGIGRLLAVTSNDEINALAALHCGELFGRSEVYQLRPKGDGDAMAGVPQHLRGRFWGVKGMTYTALTEHFGAGAVIQSVTLAKDYDYNAFKTHYGTRVLPLFLIDQAGHVTIWTTDQEPIPRVSQTIICLVDPVVPGIASAEQEKTLESMDTGGG
ncbi:MAG: cation:proton antiporter [Candidatus Binatia bacterium]